MTFGRTKPAAPVSAPDILAQKKNQLDLYNARFDHAVELFNDAIDNLGMTSHDIAETMQEISEYEKELEATKAGLSEARDKTERVIANFKSLLSID